MIKYWCTVDFHLINMGGNPINHSIQISFVFRNGCWRNYFYTIKTQSANLEGLGCLPCKIKMLLIRTITLKVIYTKDGWTKTLLWRMVTVVTRLLWFVKLLLHERSVGSLTVFSCMVYLTYLKKKQNKSCTLYNRNNYCMHVLMIVCAFVDCCTHLWILKHF